MVACVDFDEDADLVGGSAERFLKFGVGVQVVHDDVERARREFVGKADQAWHS